MAYVIDPDKCNQCGDCLDECPMEAVSQRQDGMVQIDKDMCTDCGSCADRCQQGAIRGA